MPLALDEGLAGLPPGLEGVEVLLQTLIGRLAGIDGTAALAGHSPKNLGPDQRAPVIARATSDSEWYLWPLYRKPSARISTEWLCPCHSRTKRDPGGGDPERSYGVFQRSFQLPDAIDDDKIAATFANGVLTVALPKTVEAQKQQKRIEVKAA